MQHDRHIWDRTDYLLRMIMEALGITDNLAGWNDWSAAAAEGAWY